MVYTIFLYYKNILYKNIETENGSKIKNILRICPGSAFYSRYENLYDFAQNLIRSSISVYINNTEGWYLSKS